MSIASLFDGRSLRFSAVLIGYSYASSVGVNTMAIDYAILPTVVATCLRTILPLPAVPLILTVNSLAWLFPLRLGGVIFLAQLIGGTLVALRIHAEGSASLDSCEVGRF